jgi:hypothetical protein
VFLQLKEFAGHIVHAGASVVRNMITLFFMLSWDRYRFDRKHARTHYAELLFLHLVRSVGHIGYSGASGHEMSTHHFYCAGGPGAVSIKSALGHVTSYLCFCIRWDLRVT